MFCLMGVDVYVIKIENFGIGYKESLKKLRRRLEGEGRRVYYILVGVFDYFLGGLGFVRWVWELE